jgi:hypothetical protein
MTISLAQAILTASRAMSADNGYALVPDAALRVLIEHAQGVPLPLARVEPPATVTLRDQFAMHVPIEPLAFTNDLDSVGLKRRVALALAYADAMMAARGTK